MRGADAVGEGDIAGPGPLQRGERRDVVDDEAMAVAAGGIAGGGVATLPGGLAVVPGATSAARGGRDAAAGSTGGSACWLRSRSNTIAASGSALPQVIRK